MSGFFPDDTQAPPRPLAPRLPGAPGRQPTPPALSASERRRVRRACVECRVKKVKCNGSDPCARCTSFRIQCEYGEYSARSNDASHVEGLEARMAAMEQMFRAFLEHVQAQPVPAQAARATAHGPAADRGHTDGNMQQLLDAVEADATAAGRPMLSHSTPFGRGDDEPGQRPEPESEDDTILAADRAPEGEAAETNDTGAHSPANTVDAEAAADARHRYVDGLGELDVDPYGQLRYVGLGSTVSILENCIGLRRHINKRLVKKGYNTEEPFLASPGATEMEPDVDVPASAADAATAAAAAAAAAGTPHRVPAEEDDALPPAALVEQLIGIYVHDLAFLFPIITQAEIQHIYGRLQAQPRAADRDPGYAAVFFALLAVAAPLLSAEAAAAASAITATPPRKPQQLGAAFYNAAMHYVNTPFRGKQARQGRSQDVVVALGLLSMYLAETGSQAEAWIAVGRAIRNAQDLGLHRSPERLHLPMAERKQRRYIWWCLYVLERQLCTALGRPLSVDDQDCDTEVPEDGGGVVGFACMVHLYRILGQILKMVNSVRNAAAWRRLVHDEGGQRDELRARVREANEALQAWAADTVPAAVKAARSGRLLAAKHLALSAFFAAVLLLHRLFMSTPHRPSPLAESQAQRRSAAAASDCIRATAGFLDSVPPSHHVVFHGQYVFMSAIVLLHAVRCSDDPRFTFAALKDVELATAALQRLDGFWRGARKCRATVDEYLHFTFRVLQGNRRGQCLFPCEHQHGANGPEGGGKRVAADGPDGKTKRQKTAVQTRAVIPAPEPVEPQAAPPPRQHAPRPRPPEALETTTVCPPAPPTPPSSLCSRDLPLPVPPLDHTPPPAPPPPPPTMAPPSAPPGPPVAMPPVALDGLPPPPADTHFDDTIGNFLGAISPSFHLCDPYFDGYPDVEFSGVNFVSPDGNEQQNFFF